MNDILYLCMAVIVICFPLCIGGYIVDKTTPEDKEIMEYEKQIQQRKRAAKQRKSRKA